MEPDIIVFWHDLFTYSFANENISRKYIKLPEDYTCHYKHCTTVKQWIPKELSSSFNLLDMWEINNDRVRYKLFVREMAGTGKKYFNSKASPKRSCMSLFLKYMKLTRSRCPGIWARDTVFSFIDFRNRLVYPSEDYW